VLCHKLEFKSSHSTVRAQKKVPRPIPAAKRAKRSLFHCAPLAVTSGMGNRTTGVPRNP
jgi:hypothetical protein